VEQSYTRSDWFFEEEPSGTDLDLSSKIIAGTSRGDIHLVG